MKHLESRTVMQVLLWCCTVLMLGFLAASSLRALAQSAPEKNHSKQALPLTSKEESASENSPISGGAMLAHTCAACHGTLGRMGDESFMPLAGMPVNQFVQTMKDFRDTKRPSTLMGHVARGFTDQELQAMATFFAAQTAAPATGDAL